MDLQLAGKRALVTGASKGIGRAVAGRLAEEGCDVVLVSRTAETLRVAAAEIRGRFQVSAETIAADLSTAAEIARVAAEAGEIDILVNCAGAIPSGDHIGHRRRPLPRGVGPEGVRLHRHEPGVLRGAEGARRG